MKYGQAPASHAATEAGRAPAPAHSASGSRVPVALWQFTLRLEVPTPQPVEDTHVPQEPVDCKENNTHDEHTASSQTSTQGRRIHTHTEVLSSGCTSTETAEGKTALCARETQHSKPR
jgi:hypothetical protein